MKWASLLLSSTLALAVPCETQALKSTGAAYESHRNQIALGGTPAAATTSNSENTTEELDALEKRFFRHDFSRDTVDERLTRMEKFTFGETSEGSVESRLSRLSSILETHSADTPLNSLAHTNPQKIAMAQTPATFNPPPAAYNAPDGGTTDYPHITYLEDEILGQDYPGQPLATRLARLETKAFGSPQTNPDFSSRTDALERYAEIRLHKKPFDQKPADRSLRYEDTDDGTDQAPAARAPRPEDADASLPTPPPESARLLTRVAWCEMHTFGRTYPELHLLPRLHQLNAKLFPTDHSKDIQLMDHVDSIVKEVVIRQHPPTAS